MTDAEREHLQDTYVVTEADDLAICTVWLDDPQMTPEQVHSVFVRFVGLYNHWPTIVGRKVEGAA
jgi:hypothetical protein